MILERKNKPLWVCDWALVMKSVKEFVMVPFNHLSDGEKFTMRKSGYGPTVMESRPLLRLIFEKAITVMDLVTDRSGDFLDRLKSLFYELEKRGMKLIPLGNFAGAKMGGKEHPVFFFTNPGSPDPLETWLRDNDIYEEMMALTPAKRDERLKKFLYDWTLFKVKPTVRFIEDMPGYPGIAFANPEWMEKCGLKTGFKLSGPAKDTVHPTPFHMNFNADLVLQKSGNKLKLSEEKFSRLAGYSPSGDPEKRFSENLKFVTKEGKEIFGRNPHFGMDLQALFGLTPRVDLKVANKLLRGEFDEDIKKEFFMYRDSKGDLLLNDLGREIFERGKTMADPRIRGEVYTIVLKHIKRTIRSSNKGCFGSAAPLELAPFEARKKVQKGVIVGYSGGIATKGCYVVWNNVIYVESEVWMAMGRDYDGDLAFVWPMHRFPKRHLVVNLKTLRENYVLPKKSDEGDERDAITTLIDTLRQSRLCGAMYNTGQCFVDMCRASGMPEEEVMKLYIRVMAKVETYIAGFKSRVLADTTPTVYELAKEFDVPHVTKFAVKEMFFRPLRNSGGIKIDGVKYHPLVALYMRAQVADPNSTSWWERLCSQFKGLELSPKGEGSGPSGSIEDSTKTEVSHEGHESKCTNVA